MTAEPLPAFHAKCSSAKANVSANTNLVLINRKILIKCNRAIQKNVSMYIITKPF